MKSNHRKPSVGYSLMVLLVVIIIIATGLIFFDASIQLMLFTALMALVPFVMALGFTYPEIEEAIFKSMLRALQPAIIVATVGILIGSWIASGTVPALIYYGIQSISPEFFLVTTLLFCSVVAVATGSSWATIGTAGIAMIGVGYSLGVPVGMTAGAIVSGAYFGDKLSPLSDTTNLAAAVVKTDLFTHIKHMLWTTTPAYLITAIIFTVIGLQYGEGSVNSEEVGTLTTYLSENFQLGFAVFIPPIVLFGLLITKRPAITSVFIAGLTGGVIAILYQGFSITATLDILYNGYTASEGIELVDTLLQRGGLISMLPMVAVFLFALGIGGLLESSGMLLAIINSVAHLIKNRGTLTITTAFSSYLTLAIGGTFSFVGVVTGTLLQPLFEKFNLKPENLSRIMEDSATQSVALFPWTASGVFTATALGVPTTAYIPFSFLAMFTLLFTVLYGITGFKMTEYDEGTRDSSPDDQEAS